MSYKITKSDGSLLGTIQDYTTDTSLTSISLLGRGVVNYGQLIAENFLYMLENFSSPVAPANPIVGQIWFQTEDDTDSANPQTMMVIKVYTGITSEGSPPGWKQVGGTNATDKAPTDPFLGELWYNKKDDTLYTWDGSQWDAISTTQSENAPVGPLGGAPSDGTKWLMMPEHMEWVYDSSILSPEPPFTRVGGSNDGEALTGGWRLVGPNSPQNTGTYSRFMVIKDSSGTSRQVLVNYQNGIPVTAQSSAEFTCAPDAIPNFVTHGATASSMTLMPGLNTNDSFTDLTGGQDSAVFNGSATNTLNFKDLPATAFLGRGDTWLPTTPATDNTTDFGSTTARWRFIHGNMIYAGASTDGNADISNVNVLGKSAASYEADRLSKPISIKVSGDTVGTATGDGSGDFNLSTSLSPDLQNLLKTMQSGISTAQTTANNAGQTANNALTQSVADGRYIKLTGTDTANVSGNLGSSTSNCFTNIFATKFNGEATASDYSDLAEYYQSDAQYLYGTLVKIGGGAEITQTNTKYDTDYFGVISHEPGLIMNNGKAEVSGYLPVVLSGRVPVRVSGKVAKGDRLVPSTVPGVAVSVGSMSEILAMPNDQKEQVLHSIIGRALASNDLLEEKYVECYIQSNA